MNINKPIVRSFKLPENTKVAEFTGYQRDGRLYVVVKLEEDNDPLI